MRVLAPTLVVLVLVAYFAIALDDSIVAWFWL
jgi:hypothetical protein